MVFFKGGGYNEQKGVEGRTVENSQVKSDPGWINNKNKKKSCSKKKLGSIKLKSVGEGGLVSALDVNGDHNKNIYFIDG